jgi:dTMP kinase
MKKAIWIVFEGIDGSGKTTQAKMLNDYLNGIGVKCLYQHVFDSDTGRLLRDIFIRNTLCNTVEILILCATRQSYLDELAKYEDDYDVIITDRFFLSILAMQGKSDDDAMMINYIREIICRGRDQPTLFYMDTSPAECKKRLSQKGSSDRIEEKSIEFHEAVYHRFTNLVSIEPKAYLFNGNDDIDSIHQNIVTKTLMLLKLDANYNLKIE